MRDCTIVFDLDGTLVDTAPDIIRAVNYALETAGEPPGAEVLLRPVISAGSRAMLAHRLADLGRSIGASELDAMYASLLAYYAENIAVESRPFSGMPEALSRLAARGATLAVCTNKRESHSRLLLSTLGLDGHFRALAGVDTYPWCKPDPRHLTSVIAAAGGRPERAVMVGDSDTDVRTAQAAGIPVVAVTFGYPDPRHPIESLGAEAVISHYDELEEAVTRLLGP
jgi:phosphoglycolate phosphatase